MLQQENGLEVSFISYYHFKGGLDSAPLPPQPVVLAPAYPEASFPHCGSIVFPVPFSMGFLQCHRAKFLLTLPYG